MLLGLLRVKQYYKNLLVFIAVVFAGLVFDFNAVFLSFLGFIALCLVSSSNYILNDYANIAEDRKHKEKKKRPLASGKISSGLALFVAAVLVVLSLILAMSLSTYFFYLVILMFFLTQLYTLFFRKELFLDILFISINFVIRAVAGAVILDVRISPWLILCTFFLSLFIAVGKRSAEVKSGVKRSVLKMYDEKLVSALLIITSTLLFVSYGMYSFLSVYPYMIFTVPFAFYVVLRYLYLVYSGSEIAMKSELFYKDYRLVLGIIAWFVVSGAVVYISLMA
jgi:4-hydroxybenzoate polyprenyltransferase